MYGKPTVTAAGPALVAGATLPATGMDFVMSLALAVAAGLVAWGAVYYFQVVRQGR